MELPRRAMRCVSCNDDVMPLSGQTYGLRCKFCKQLMHAHCCGLSDAEYRVLVNRQTAGIDDTWPCRTCARSPEVSPPPQQSSRGVGRGRVRGSRAATTSRAQPSPRSPSVSPPPSSTLQQRRNSASVSPPQQPPSSPHQQQSPRSGVVKLVTVARGGLRLCHGGYSYTKKAEKKTRIRWECSQRKTHQCKGAVTTSLMNDDLHVTAGHTHSGDAAAVDAANLKEKMREQVRSVRAQPGAVLAASLHGASNDVRVALGQTENIKRALRRQKRCALPAEPTSLADIDVSGPWLTTRGPQPQPFLIYDSGSTATDRMLVFSSPEQLRHLATSDRWFMDGNFAMAPKLFLQLYVIRAAVGDSAVTCVYALLTGKSQSLYERMLTAVVDACDRMGVSADPTTVVCDFESAVMNAVRTTLGSHVTVHGCFFHLCQSTWRRIQDLGLVQAYRNKSEVRLFCSMLDALAFLPVSDVSVGMRYLQQNVPSCDETDQLLQLLTYFDTTYVSGAVRRVQRPATFGTASIPTLVIRRLPPLFPPTVWNVYDATINGTDRTNNLCESWNRGFSAIVGQQHPSLWCMIEALQQDAAAETTVLLQNARGQPPAKRVKRATVRLQQQLKSVCCDHRDGRKSVAQTLAALSHSIRLD